MQGSSIGCLHHRNQRNALVAAPFASAGVACAAHDHVTSVDGNRGTKVKPMAWRQAGNFMNKGSVIKADTDSLIRYTH